MKNHTTFYISKFCIDIKHIIQSMTILKKNTIHMYDNLEDWFIMYSTIFERDISWIYFSIKIISQIKVLMTILSMNCFF